MRDLGSVLFICRGELTCPPSMACWIGPNLNRGSFTRHLSSSLPASCMTLSRTARYVIGLSKIWIRFSAWPMEIDTDTCATKKPGNSSAAIAATLHWMRVDLPDGWLAAASSPVLRATLTFTLAQPYRQNPRQNPNHYFAL